jgi:hypothetical protein
MHIRVAGLGGFIAPMFSVRNGTAGSPVVLTRNPVQARRNLWAGPEGAVQASGIGLTLALQERWIHPPAI